MASRFYLRSITQGGFRPSNGEHSVALPSGTGAGSFTPWDQLDVAAGTIRGEVVGSSLAQTAHQDGAIQGFSSVQLKAQTIGSGTWTLAVQLKESSANANALLVLSLYIWRPSTGAIVGYIYDSDTTLGSEWSTGPNGSGQLVTFSGSSVDVEDGDVLALEVWFHAAQASATSFTNSVFLNGSTAVTAGYTGTDPASYLEPPADVVLYDGLTFRALTSATVSGGTGIAAAPGPVGKVDDLVIAIYGGLAGTGSGDPITTSGNINSWNEVTLDNATWGPVNGLNHNYRVFWIVAASGDFANLAEGTFKSARFNPGGNPAALHVLVWRGNDTITPLSDTADQANSHSSSTAVEAPSVDALGPPLDSVLQSTFLWSRGGLGGSSGTAPPTGMTEVGDTSSIWPSLETAIEYIEGGATGTRTATAAQSHDKCAAISLMIRSAVEAVGGLDGYWGVLLLPA